MDIQTKPGRSDMNETPSTPADFDVTTTARALLTALLIAGEWERIRQERTAGAEELEQT